MHLSARGVRLPSTQRVLEVVPTATVWLIITAPVWGAIVAPAALGFGMVLFSVYWLWKSFGFASGVLIAPDLRKLVVTDRNTFRSTAAHT